VAFHTDDGRTVDREFDSSWTNDGYPPALGANQKLCLSVGTWLELPGSKSDQSADMTRQAAWEQARGNDAIELPTRWYGYDGVDVLMIATSHPDAVRALRPDSAQFQALDEWVRQGGRLLLSVGSEAEGVLGAKDALAQLAPGTLVGVES